MAVSEQIMRENTGINKADGSGNKLSYAEAVKERSEIEEKIGLSLAQDSRLTGIAAKITEKSKVKSYGELDGTGKDKIGKEVDKFGGARAYKERWGTLGASVFAVMNEIEKDSATKSYYSKVQEGNTENPYFGDPGEKKPEFDEPLASLKWEDIPTNIKTELTDNLVQGPFRKLPASTYDELDFKGKLTLLKGFRYDGGKDHSPATTLLAQAATGGVDMDEIQEAFDHPDDDEKRQKAIKAIKTAMSNPHITANKKATLGALLDIVVDRHTSGDNTNLVRRKGDGGVKDQWIEDTVKAGKPIISGPSGHTLRYLNFWAEKRNEADPTEVNDTEKWPSLEAARLVMMANLMPPKHHSYDEIMTASIGIKDSVGPALEYHRKTSYRDLLFYHTQDDANPIAKNAFKESDARSIDNDDNDGIDISIKQDIDARKDLPKLKADLQKVLSTADAQKIRDAIEVLRGTKTVTK